MKTHPSTTSERRRLLNETQFEAEANAILSRCEAIGSATAMAQAADVLNQAINEPIDNEIRAKIVVLCQKLYESCGLQASISKYHASGGERGAFLDYVDYPLNYRWWLHDQFEQVRGLTSEADRCRKLMEIARWEAPGVGSYYDDIGNPAKSPHAKSTESYIAAPGQDAYPLPTQWWWDEGMSRARLSWQSTMNYPEAVVYEGLDPDATYTVRMSGYGRFLLRVDGEPVGDPNTRIAMGEVSNVAVPAQYFQDRKLVLTWDRPNDEGHLNWRKHSRLAEVWLLKHESLTQDSE